MRYAIAILEIRCSGDDELYGQSGDDVLLGRNNNDLLFGQSGDDILVGGSGFDELSGGGGDDLLLGAATTFDTDPSAWLSIRDEWLFSAATVPGRITNILVGGGLNGANTLTSGVTVFDDGAFRHPCERRRNRLVSGLADRSGQWSVGQRFCHDS